MGKDHDKKDLQDGKGSIQNKTEKILNRLSLPLSLLSGTFQMEMAGNKEVTIDGVQGVIEYNDDCIRVSTGKMVIKFSGRNLSLKALTSDTLIISGFILAIEFI